MAAHTRMADADRLLRAGCLDCLIDAYHGYRALLDDPTIGHDATVAAARAAMLIAIRERELGMVDSGALGLARVLADSLPSLAASLAPLFDIVDTLGVGGGPGSGGIASDAQIATRGRASRNRTAWTDALRARADDDDLTAYLWVAFNCSYNSRTNEEADGLLDMVPVHRETALIRFRLATCLALRMPTLEQMLVDDPRFLEIRYYVSLQALLGGDLDGADMQLSQAYMWRPRWPSVTNLRASVFMTAEDFESAADFYGRTLVLVPDDADALLGRVRALTYQGRYMDALTAVDALFALEHWYQGDAYYWRATNELQLARYENAWDDVERAATLITNAEVPKLAGIIAVQRQRLEDARTKFDEAHRRNTADCETTFYLGVVLSEQGEWAQSAETLVIAADCLDRSAKDLQAQIAAISTSVMSLERKVRQVARREQQIASEVRRRATSLFNIAVASLNLSRYGEARQYAALVANDPQFGDRARQLLSRLPAP